MKPNKIKLDLASAWSRPDKNCDLNCELKLKRQGLLLGLTPLGPKFYKSSLKLQAWVAEILAIKLKSQCSIYLVVIKF